MFQLFSFFFIKDGSQEENPCESNHLGRGDVAVVALHGGNLSQGTDRERFPSVHPVSEKHVPHPSLPVLQGAYATVYQGTPDPPGPATGPSRVPVVDGPFS
jgi:hypothetical protein